MEPVGIGGSSFEIRPPPSARSASDGHTPGSAAVGPQAVINLSFLAAPPDLVAGAFGSHLDSGSAYAIGYFAKISSTRVNAFSAAACGVARF
jgi:hypothetical protein